MRGTRGWSVALLLVVFSAGTAFGAEPASIAGRFRRGVSLHGPLTWGRANADRTGYLQPVYDDDPRYVLPVELLRRVKAVGFDFIRLSVDPGPLLALTGAERDALDDHCLDIVRRIRALGLDVVFDFHPISMVRPFGRTAIMTSEGDTLLTAYVALVSRFARRLAPLDPGHIALEPMNEPAIGNDPAATARWQGLMDRLYDAVRAEAPRLPVVVTGGSGGNLDALLALQPGHYDRNTLYSFHFYRPYLLTHAGVGNPLSIQTFASGLPYPADPAGLAEFQATLEQRVNAHPRLEPTERSNLLTAGRRQVENYFRTEGRLDYITTNFDKVAQWARQHGLDPGQIFLGEFGVTQQGRGNAFGILPEDRARWLTDVRREAEARGFGWAMWNLTGASAWGMVLTELAHPDRLDALTLAALGLTASE